MKGFDFAALERRVKALESWHMPSLRMGKVVGVKGGHARVRLDDGQTVTTFFLPTLQRRVLVDQEIKMPDDEEPVAVLFCGQGYENGFVLGAYYSTKVPDPGVPRHWDYSKFKDGAEFYYDREESHLMINVPGLIDCLAKTLNVIIQGTITVEGAELDTTIKGDITTDAGGDITTTASGDISTTASGDVSTTASGAISETASGAITMTASGAIVQTAAGAIAHTAEGAIVQAAAGAITQTAAGAITQTAEGAIEQSAGGVLSLTSTGVITLTSAVQVVIEAAGGLNVVGAGIFLNGSKVH